MRQIGGRGMGTFYGLSPDSHSNLYVTDYAISLIRVFHVDGDLLRSFGCDENGEVKMRIPSGVCVAGQYVYVTDVGHNSVSVFTTEGAYVTLFGHRGREEGCFDCPCALCVDRDGFVYVVDKFNRKFKHFNVPVFLMLLLSSIKRVQTF